MNKITIDVKVYDKLILDSLKLRCLEAGGVRHWNGYNIVMNEIEQWKKGLIKRVLKEKKRKIKAKRSKETKG